MPAEIPVVLLGQLGVDKRYQGKKLGSDLLTDAYKRVLQTSDLIGVRALMVQATDDQAKSFYERRGFSQFSDREPLMLIVRISQLKN
jgi:ribosomal protein S18 acetylase RimI-like enzyme